MMPVSPVVASCVVALFSSMCDAYGAGAENDAFAALRGRARAREAWWEQESLGHRLKSMAGVHGAPVLNPEVEADVGEDEPPTLLQMGATEEEGVKNGPMYMVNVGFDWENHNPADGMTIVIDKKARALRVDPGIKPTEGVAWLHMTDHLDVNGWIELHVQTTESARSNNDVKMYAAGFIEGLASAARISQFYSNSHQTLMKDEANFQALANIKKMFHDELEFVKTNTNFKLGVVTIEPPDPYWKHARYVLEQMWGIKDAFNFVAVAKGVHQLDLIDFLIINSNGEMPELVQAYTPAAVAARRKFQQTSEDSFMQKNSTMHGRASGKSGSRQARKGDKPEPCVPHGKTGNRSDWTSKLSDRDWEDRLAHTGHCSALVRLAPENVDLLVGHTTWNDYSKMTRMFKYYAFKLPGSHASVNVAGFSSYPGCVTSTDDFYMLDSGLAVMDTSLEILNPTVYNRVAEFPANTHIPNFMHIMTVNRIAKSATQWTTLFTERNSGTNNAQWIIVDYNIFESGKPLRDNTVWLLEQVPGLIEKADVSKQIRGKGYWASYDRPYFKQVRTESGHTYAEGVHGALYSFDGAPRAQIFSKIGAAVEGLFDMRAVMNRNAYPNEGILPNEPGHSIAARMDLDPVSHIPNGAIDAKVTNRCLFRMLQCQAISSPSHQQQPIFSWTDANGKELFGGWPHFGLPNQWNFNWVQMTPTKTLPKLTDVSQC